MPCPGARVCGEPGARGGSARGTEPSGDRSQPRDSGSVRDRVEGLGLRAPLTHDGEEAEKQERRQVLVAGSSPRRPARLGVARLPRARGGPRSRLESGPARHRPGPRVGSAGPRPQFRAGEEGLGGERGPSRDSVPSPGSREGLWLEEPGVVLGFAVPWGTARAASWSRGPWPPWHGRVGVVVAALLLAEVWKSSFLLPVCL